MLEPADIADDLDGIFISHSLDRRHVAVRPVVGAGAVSDRQVEAGVRMVIRLINRMDQRRAVVRSHRILPVAGAAMSFEQRLALGHLRRRPGRRRRR